MQCKKTLHLGWRQDGDVHQVRSEFACTSREDPADRASVLAAVAVAEFCFLSLAHSVKMLALWRTSPYPVPLKAAEKDGRILLVLVLWLFFCTSLTGVLGVFLFPHFNRVACFHFLALASFTFGASLRSTWYGKNVHAYTNWGVRHTGRQTHWRHTKWAGVCQAVVVYLIYVTTITTTAGVCILHKYVHTPTTPLVMHTAWTVATVRFTEPLQLHLLVAFLLLFLLLSSYEWRKRCFFFSFVSPTVGALVSHSSNKGLLEDRTLFFLGIQRVMLCFKLQCMSYYCYVSKMLHQALCTACLQTILRKSTFCVLLHSYKLFWALNVAFLWSDVSWCFVLY